MKKQFGMVMDLNRCTGCNACIIACKQENDLPPKLDAVPGSVGFSFIRVECIGPQGEYPELSMYYRPIPCMHCTHPPCIEVCPTEAISKRDDGIVLIDPDACTACEACLDECPYNVICMDSAQAVARKCTFCVDRIDRGQPPACVAACNAGAMMFGNLTDPNDDIARVINTGHDDCFILKPEMETRPAVYYLGFRKKE
jgi:Fe-S-cluster-containing dehydrogenase component